MPRKTINDQKISLTKSERLVSTRKTALEYDSEYKQIKPFIESENFEQCQKYLENLEKKIKSTKTDKKYNKLIVEYLKFYVFSRFSKISDAMDVLKVLEKNQSISQVESSIYIDFTNAKADVYWKIGKLKEALTLLENLEKNFPQISNLSDKILERIGDLFRTKGIIYWMLGEVQDSQNAFQTSLTIMGRAGNKNKFAIALNNLGNVYIYKGELDFALEHHLQALEMRMQLGVKNQIASSLGNIAEIYQYKGDYKKSLENYLQAKEIFEEINNLLFCAKLYYQLVTLHLEYSNLNHAREILDELDKLRALAPTNEYIQMLFNFSEGLYFKNSERLLDKFHGAINFNSIVNDKKVIDNEITIQAILNLTDILLLEIRLSNNEEILNDIYKYCEKVHKIALNQNSTVLLVQGFLLESKLKLLDFKFQEAKNVLNKAVSMSKEKGISRLEYFASRELDKLLQTEEKWLELKERHASLQERLDLTGIEETLQSLTRKREEVIEIEREEPILFIILQEGGLTAFSSKFKEGIRIDDQLIGGFISAVNTFGQHIFSTTGQVERIKHGDYTLISKIVLNKFTFCYVFKGPSYLASKKFDKLISKFLLHPIQKVFISNVRTGYLLDDPDEHTMKKLVNESIFLSEENEQELITSLV